MSARRASRRDDAVLGETRWASGAIVLILLPAVVVLWGFPGRTADLWAWAIKPDMTPIFMGSAYGAGAYFFFRVARGRRWHPASAGVLSAAVFAGLMLLVTVLHWDRFNHGDAPTLAAIAFYGWVGVYVVSPLIVGGLWLRNRRRDPQRAAPGDRRVPLGARRAAAAVALGGAAAAAALLLAPATAAVAWPWQLTPLTARVVGCFTAQVALGALILSRDPRWSSWRLLLETFLIASALLLVGAARSWDAFVADAAAWAFVGGLVGFAAAIALLMRAMAGRRPQGRATAAPA